MKRIVSFIVVFTLVMGGMTHAQAQSKAAEKAEKKLERKEKKEIRYRDTSYLPFRYREIHKGIQRIDMKRIGNEFKRR